MSRKAATEELKKHIYNDLVRGANNAYLVEMIGTDGYNIGYTLNSPTAKDLIAKVRKGMREDFEAEKPELKATMLARLFDLFTEAKDASDRLTALKVLQEINKVTGLYEPTKIDANLKQDVQINFGFGDENESSNED